MEISYVWICIFIKLNFLGSLSHSLFNDAMHHFSTGVQAARLDDANFEHDTQASTGATTGFWLIIL